MKNFKESLARVAKREAESGNQGVYGITKFSDMSTEEFKSVMLTYRPSKHENISLLDVSSEKLNNPVYLDWRNNQKITPVKDQGQCGSCWAFSATEAIESAWMLAGHPTAVLAPQQMVSCDTLDHGCQNGFPGNAFHYIASAGGQVPESAFPYHSGNGNAGTCTVNLKSVVAKLNPTNPWKAVINFCGGGTCASQPELPNMENALQSGPMSVCLNAGPFQDYVGGILSANCDASWTALDHCVQLVGYNNAPPSPYWIVRNSWGLNWGYAGYVYIIKGKNMCGIADEVMVPNVA